MNLLIRSAKTSRKRCSLVRKYVSKLFAAQKEFLEAKTAKGANGELSDDAATKILCEDGETTQGKP